MKILSLCIKVLFLLNLPVICFVDRLCLVAGVNHLYPTALLTKLPTYFCFQSCPGSFEKLNTSPLFHLLCTSHVFVGKMLVSVSTQGDVWPVISPLLLRSASLVQPTPINGLHCSIILSSAHNAILVLKPPELHFSTFNTQCVQLFIYETCMV